MEAFLQSHWFWDIAIVVVLLLYVLVKANKGFFDCIIPVIILVAAIVGSYVITPMIEPSVEEKLTPWLISKVEEKISDTDLSSLLKDVSGKILGGNSSEDTSSSAAIESTVSSAALSKLKDSIKGKSIEDLTQAEKELVDSISSEIPDKVKEMAQQYGVDISDAIVNNIDSLDITGSIKDQVSSLATSVVKNAASKAIYTGCYIVVALALMLILNIIKAILSPLLKSIPVVGGVNKIAGAILGLIQGILVIYIVVNILSLFNLFGIRAVAGETYLLKLFLQISPAEIISKFSGT